MMIFCAANAESMALLMPGFNAFTHTSVFSCRFSSQTKLYGWRRGVFGYGNPFTWNRGLPWLARAVPTWLLTLTSSGNLVTRSWQVKLGRSWRDNSVKWRKRFEARERNGGRPEFDLDCYDAEAVKEKLHTFGVVTVVALIVSGISLSIVSDMVVNMPNSQSLQGENIAFGEHLNSPSLLVSSPTLTDCRANLLTVGSYHNMRSHALIEKRMDLVLNSLDSDTLTFGAADRTTTCDASLSPENIIDETIAKDLTNESIVREVWQIVNDYFLDARHHKWSSDAWQTKKEEVLKRSIPSRMAAYGIIRSMLRELNDPYTRFITPRELKDLSKYDLTGIGLSLGEVADGYGVTSLKVVGLVLGSPAQLAGVKQGDELLSVDGMSMKGKSPFEASSLIQGPKGTHVTIEIKHGPCGEIGSISVERQQRVQTPVYYHLKHGPSELVGYIRLKEFNAVAKRDLVTAMNRLRIAGATSFLLDLQDNPGGLVQAGIEVAKLFLDEGEKVVYTAGKDLGTQKNIVATGPPLTTAPVIVLVNNHTASASEIVAAALHDNCRAVLAGHRTFGKGLIQSVFELSDGSGVILTVGKYITPNQQDIDGNGIEPDFQQIPGLSEAKKKLQNCHIPA